MMVFARALLAMVLVFLVAACQPPRLTPLELQRRYQAHAHEKVNSLSYIGSGPRDHHFNHFFLGMQRIDYRVSRKDLVIKDEFPLTDDVKQWRPYRVFALDAVGSGGVLLVPSAEWEKRLSGSGPRIEGVPEFHP